MSISNSVSSLCGSLAPIVAGHVLADATSEYLWRKVFFVTAGLYFFTNLLYVLLGTAERAYWNSEPEAYWNSEPEPKAYHAQELGLLVEKEKK